MPLKKNETQDTLQWSIDYLKQVLSSDGEWYITDKRYRGALKGVLDFAENDPIDSIVVETQNYLKQENYSLLFDRRPQDIVNKKQVPGYLMPEELGEQVMSYKESVVDSLQQVTIETPDSILSIAKEKVDIITVTELPVFSDLLRSDLPATFKVAVYQRLETEKAVDSLRTEISVSERDSLIESTRIEFNSKLIQRYCDSVANAYQAGFIRDFADSASLAYEKKLEERNYDALVAYNDLRVYQVNDSIRQAIGYLAQHAENDSILFRISNLSNDQYSIWTARRDMKPIRLFLKNEQNDSLGVILRNLDKGNVKLIIDDGVQFTRFTATHGKEVTLKKEALDKRLVKFEKKGPTLSPWKLGGDWTLGFTQTALSNWAKGGESSMSLLATARYSAKYNKNKLKWENDFEVRYGINRTKTKGFQKNDDKIEINSRVGYSAFKKWYYSGEWNFRTQLARGYKYPDKDNPISTFMAPAYMTIALGLDYKPNKDFSFFASPLTSKSTFVSDTALIDPTRYGIRAGKKASWETGLILKANFEKKLHENISYSTKAELFSNYRSPFSKFDFEWENLLVMQVTQYINARVMTNLIYDDDVKFKVYDADGNDTGEKETRWQFKELFTIGFTYKF